MTTMTTMTLTTTTRTTMTSNRNATTASPARGLPRLLALPGTVILYTLNAPLLALLFLATKLADAAHPAPAVAPRAPARLAA